MFISLAGWDDKNQLLEKIKEPDIAFRSIWLFL
jgi:hypothetical protein